MDDHRQSAGRRQLPDDDEHKAGEMVSGQTDPARHRFVIAAGWWANATLGRLRGNRLSRTKSNATAWSSIATSRRHPQRAPLAMYRCSSLSVSGRALVFAVSHFPTLTSMSVRSASGVSAIAAVATLFDRFSGIGMICKIFEDSGIENSRRIDRSIYHDEIFIVG